MAITQSVESSRPKYRIPCTIGLPEGDARVKALEEKIHQHLVKMLNQHTEAPLFGLAGVPLVNVLEVNLALADWVAAALRS